MAEIKIKGYMPRSEWVEYELDTDLLDPAVLRVRLKPIDGFMVADELGINGELKRIGEGVVRLAMAAVVEWDLTKEGEAIEVTEENKALYLRPLLTAVVKNRMDMMLGVALVMDAQNRERFLKN